MTYNSIKNYDTLKMIILDIKCISQGGLASHPNPKVLWCEAATLLTNIHQHLCIHGEYPISFSYKSLQIGYLPNSSFCLEQIYNYLDSLLAKSAFKEYLKLEVCADLGELLYLPDCSPANYQGDIFRRLDKISPNPSSNNKVQLIITHSLYENLSTKDRGHFKTALYLNHICCYLYNDF